MSINEQVKMGQVTTAELVKNKNATFQNYCNGFLNYKTEDGFEFSVPLEDTGAGIFKNEHKAIELMRWIRKQVDIVKAS